MLLIWILPAPPTLSSASQYDHARRVQLERQVVARKFSPKDFVVVRLQAVASCGMPAADASKPSQAACIRLGKHQRQRMRDHGACTCPASTVSPHRPLGSAIRDAQELRGPPCDLVFVAMPFESEVPGEHRRSYSRGDLTATGLYLIVHVVMHLEVLVRGSMVVLRVWAFEQTWAARQEELPTEPGSATTRNIMSISSTPRIGLVQAARVGKVNSTKELLPRSVTASIRSWWPSSKIAAMILKALFQL